ncbi:39S ribosomal protein L9, mitochondrial-like [Pollicipes pollicipes]|uniref:39S ribosomal protein L9, mitochondrial-like n=1 Tax=Pollicipes pollicipes TaxID=41117 RepID=UPI001884B05D|nr:39S ribosomal protein L9, mitochondrial-like [Pollicipes pollicipes]XP_037080340.1 39S ribosomal protein L9, mitochondrial-like [Pollicipes pollicipes]XP_037080341.1 39S ribosomal protein L9, mitochondrial-like [Pollicipes pollicipes]
MLLGGSSRQLVAAALSFTTSSCLRNASKYTGTFVLKRRHAPLLGKRSFPDDSHRPLRRRHKIYDTIERPATQPLPDIDVILTRHVEGLGKPGDVVAVKVTRAHNELLALGRAVYASPENLEKYRNVATESASEQEQQHSSIYSAQTVKTLSSKVLGVTMNLEEPWTLQPWHLRVAFRKAGYVVPESCLELPAQPIQGPDVDGLEGKEFIVTVTVNGCERVPVRCRLHHYAADPRDRLPYVWQWWLRPAEPLFPEEAERLAAMPRPLSQLRDDGQ